MSTRSLTLAALFVAGAAFAWSPSANAQDPGPKDDALDKLLEKLDDSTPPPAASKPSADDAKAQEDAPKEELSEKDKALDSLLEKLGETKEEASPDEKKGPSMPGADEPPTSLKPEEATKLEGKDAELDKHLKGLTGRKEKPKKQQQQQGDGKGPLTDAIKKMEEAEQRLKKTDTGEQTRKTQGEIVKQLDSILEQIRNAQGQGKGSGKPMTRITQAGNKPGDQPGEQPGNTGAGVGPMRPATPPKPSDLAAKNKDIWGDLPPALREEMENVFREEALPGKQRLIDRYFLTVSKKSIAAKE